MTKLDAARQSPHNILANSKASRAAFDKTWNVASRAPVFCKISKKSINGVTKKTFRTARLVGSHAYNIAASGAAATSARILEEECKALRLEAEPENTRAPWLPGVSKGARMVIEQFLCALAQEATMKAHAVREGSGSSKRLNGKHMRLAWEAVFDTVFADTSIMPRSMHVAAPESKRSSKGKKADKKKDAAAEEDDDYAPPSEGADDE